MKNCIFCGTTKKGKQKPGYNYFCEDKDCKLKYKELKNKEAVDSAVKINKLKK